MKNNKLVKWLAVLFVLLGIGALVGGSIVFAATSGSRAGETTVIVSAGEEEDAEPGIVISSLEPDGPAAAAGVARGDILLEFDEQPVNTVFELWNILAEKEVGDAVRLRVLHGDDERWLTATLGDQAGRPYLGVRPCDGLPGLPGLTVLGDLPHVEDMPIMPETLGAVIVRVSPDGPADKAGLRSGDRIIKVEDQELDAENGLADLITAHEPGETVTLEIQRVGEEPFEVTVQLAEHPDKQGVAYLGVEYQPLLRYQFQRDSEGDDQPFGRRFFNPFPSDGEPLFRLPEGEGELQQGVIVRSVAEGSPAEGIGLSKGDVIAAVDGELLEAPQDLVDAISKHKSGDTVTLTLLISAEEEQQVEVELAQHPDNEDQGYLGVIIGGFVRSRHLEQPDLPWGYRLIEPFLEPFKPNRDSSFEPGRGLRFEFDWHPEHLEQWPPLDLGFDFPEWLQEAPCCQGDNTL